MESPLSEGGGGYAEHHEQQEEQEQHLIQLGDISQQQQAVLPQTFEDPQGHLLLAPPPPAAPQQTYGGLQLEDPTGGISTTLLVTNLPYRIRWQDLKDLFRRYGTPTRADVFLAPDGRSRGVGMVMNGLEGKLVLKSMKREVNRLWLRLQWQERQYGKESLDFLLNLTTRY